MSAPAPAAPPRPPRRWLVWLLAIVVALALVVVLGGAWLLRTEQGARFALERAVRAAGDGIRYEGVEGTLSSVLRVKVIEVSRDDMYARVEDVVLEASPLQPLRGRIHVQQLAARSVELRTVDTGAAAKVPASFAPPFEVRLDAGRVGELRVGDLTREAAAEKDMARKRALMQASRGGDLVLRDIFLKGEGDRREWRIGEARVETQYGRASLAGSLGSESPFAIDLKAAASGVAAERPYQAKVVATGTLKSIEASLEGEVSGQYATGRALIEPFGSFPIRTLELRAREFDLAKHAEGPRTRLSVEVKLAGEGKSFSGPVRIENAEPGPWDKQKLPFTALAARIVATTERLDVNDLHLALVGGGSARGRATLQKSGVEALLAVADVDLAALHGELQKTRVSGRVSIAGDRAAQRFDVALKDPRFEIEGRAAAANQRLDVQAVRVSTGGGAVVAKGGMALAGASGELDFTIGRSEDALFEGFNSGSRIANARVIKVQVSTIDEEWRALDRPHVSAIKIDVEGGEGGVLEGAGELLAARRPPLLLEWHEPYLSRFGTPPESLLALARRFGYQIFTVPGGVPVADEATLRVQMMSCQNYLLLPGDRQ